MEKKIRFTSIKETKALELELLRLIQATWNPITLASQTLQDNWDRLFRYLPDFQFVLQKDDTLIGYACSIPFFWEKDLHDLPAEGWDWLLQTGIRGFEDGIAPNLLGGLMIGVAPAYRGQQWSKVIIQHLKAQATHLRLQQLVIPIRPTLKDQYPEIQMETYITWKKEARIFDPWIRTHLNSGAEYIKVCPKAMTIKGTLQEWETWTGQRITQSGAYIVPETLAPVRFDVEKQIGIYEEPNVWISYQLQSQHS